MKRIIAGLLLASLTAGSGCDNGSPGSPGGPGVTDTTAKAPLYGQADNTFVLTTSSLELKQGNDHEATIGIKRGTNFNQDVALAFEAVPAGITIEPAKPIIPKDGTETKFKIKASHEAGVGEFLVKVVGRPTTGGNATNQFTVTIAKMDTFTMSIPSGTTTLKQGESKPVAITISREEQFDQEVSITIDGLPKGITMEPSKGVIKSGDKEVSLNLTAAEDAAIGDFTAKVIAHPMKGTDTTQEMKITVAKK